MNKKTIAVFSVTLALLLFGSLVFANPLNLKETRAEKPTTCLFPDISEVSYEEWNSQLLERNPRALQVITEENFDQFIQMKIAMSSGNYEQANQIREELGLGEQNLQRKTMAQQNQQTRKQTNNNQQTRTQRNQQLQKKLHN
jgi:hypothetical protein